VANTEKIEKEFTRNSIYLLITNFPKNFNQIDVKKSLFSGLNITKVHKKSIKFINLCKKG